MIKYLHPDHWIKYNPLAIAESLANAKAGVLSLTNIPYQRSWVDKLQIVQLKREVAGTSRIEGAEFTDKELDAAMSQTPEELSTRSQRQAQAAVKTYMWIRGLPTDYPVNAATIIAVHEHIIIGADDDHCPPGKLRPQDVNVNFGVPPHRGAEGGEECKKAFDDLCRALNDEYRGHDPLVQALAAHYHIAAMHPFEDGNGRTARALEALMLRRVGLKDTLFIAMSNYYYEGKNDYLKYLGRVRAARQDLTEFLIFGLKGVERQCNKLFQEISKNVSKALFLNIMLDLFTHLRNKRKRALAERQMTVLRLLLENEQMELRAIHKATANVYGSLKNPWPAFIRDLNYLHRLKAIRIEKKEETFHIIIRLSWPTEITETAFYKSMKSMPKSKTLEFWE